VSIIRTIMLTRARRVIGIALIAAASSGSHAQSLPDSFATSYGAMQELGNGRLRFLGFHVYDAKLWSEALSFDFDRRFALGLRYARNFRGTDIADRSVQEIRSLGRDDEALLKHWGARMSALFVDIAAGDELISVNDPGKGARFYLNGKRLGEIADPAFARAFFSIWLDPKTSAPALRAQLLGGSR
jgi:Chalcone isomerase-like